MTFKPSPTSSASRAALTEDLIARGATDLERWRDPNNLATQWDTRAELAGRLVGPDPVAVLDIGAGAMALRDFLAPGSRYTPADVAKRSDDCFVVDLNRQEFPPGAFDVVTFLGVLEYIHDAAWPLRQAAIAAPRLVISYCTDVEGARDYRRGMGWVNDYTAESFEQLLAETGWQAEARVEHKRGVTNVQYLWKCAKAAR